MRVNIAIQVLNSAIEIIDAIDDIEYDYLLDYTDARPLDTRDMLVKLIDGIETLREDGIA